MTTVPSDILGRPLEVGQWVAIGARDGSCGSQLLIRQIIDIREVPYFYSHNRTRPVAFFHQTNGREVELINAERRCLILNNYEGFKNSTGREVG